MSSITDTPESAAPDDQPDRQLAWQRHAEQPPGGRPHRGDRADHRQTAQPGRRRSVCLPPPGHIDRADPHREARRQRRERERHELPQRALAGRARGNCSHDHRVTSRLARRDRFGRSRRRRPRVASGSVRPRRAGCTRVATYAIPDVPIAVRSAGSPRQPADGIGQGGSIAGRNRDPGAGRRATCRALRPRRRARSAVRRPSPRTSSTAARF